MLFLQPMLRIKAKETIAKMNGFIDFRMGLIGALFMGSIVFWINHDHGYDEALIAGLKQLSYTFFFGGLFIKMAENIAVTRKNRAWGVFIGGLLPMVLTAILTYTVHSMKGTPEPFNSTIPTIVSAWISFTVWGWLKTR